MQKVRTMDEAVRYAKKNYYKSRLHLFIDKIRGHHDYRKAMLRALDPKQYQRFIRKARRAIRKVRTDERNLRVSDVQLGKLRLIHSDYVYYVDETHLFGGDEHRAIEEMD